MPSGSSRERVLSALAFKEPDQVPIDFGGTPATSITMGGYEKLLRYLGFDEKPAVMVKSGLIALPSEKVMRFLGSDCRAIICGPRDGWTDIELPGGGYRDEWGVVRTQPEGGGHFMVTGHPLASASTIADIRSYPWPDPSDPGLTRGLRARALALREETGCCLVANLPHCMIHEAQDIRGFEQWMIDIALDRPFAEYLLDTILDISIEIAGRMLSEIGDIVDVVYMQDDFAGQSGPLISPSLYREIIKPRHARLIEVIKKHTSARMLYHSCGAVSDFLEDFIEIGVDALNPVQVSAAGMDTKVLKKRFHGRLAFWGAIDSQQVLSHGTRRDVEREVSRRIGDLAPGGGYVLAAVHNIQDDVPPENVVAMFQSARSSALSLSPQEGTTV